MEADYDNYEMLIEIPLIFELPSGHTRTLRALLDTGATDDFVHSRVVSESNIQYTSFENPESVTMGAAGSEASALGETKVVTWSIGSVLKHKSKFTVLDLGDYDVILGRPFQKFVQARIEGDDVFVPTRRGYQALPRWVGQKGTKPKLIRLSRLEMQRELLKSDKSEEGSFDLYLKPFSATSSKDPDFQTSHRDSAVEEELKKHSPETPGNEEAKAQFAKLPRPQNNPELEKLLWEFKDVFPADLPTELPPERGFEMKLPSKPGTVPPHQAPYRANPEAQKMIQQTLEYLTSHGLIRESLSEYAAPVTLVPKPDGTWRFCTDYRRLNSVTNEARFPLPRMDDCIDQVGHASYFSTIDLRSGYWQMRVHPDVTPLLMLLTDGAGNVAISNELSPQEEAHQLADQIAAEGIRCVVVNMEHTAFDQGLAQSLADHLKSPCFTLSELKAENLYRAVKQEMEN